MRLETFPLIVAVLVALVGLGLIVDANTADRSVRRERRRAPRIERHRGGETLLGVGILALAAALAGRDAWRYSIVAALVGALLVLWGAILNRRYIRSALTNRGALRRRDPSQRLNPPPGRSRPAASPTRTASPAAPPPPEGPSA